jgi:hypothetical protein
MPAPSPLPPGARTSPTPSTPAPAPDTASADATCRGILASGRLVADPVPPIAGPGACGIAAPLKLKAIVLADGRQVPVEPPALMRCTLASAIADWMREDVAPLVERDGAHLSKIRDADSYDCRGRNRVVGAKLSEHGKGNAFDVGALVDDKGRSISVEKSGDMRPLLASLKQSACARFATVLGPGSDGYHEQHLHVDLAERRNNYKLCEWNLR